MDSKIAIITYDHPHKKTQDLVFESLRRGRNQISLFAIPWRNFQNKNHSIVTHRPKSQRKLSQKEFYNFLEVGYQKVKVSELINIFKKNQFDHIIIGGAGILPAELALKFKIINAHPGLLPRMRGLDALKWAIYKALPIGITVHYISPEADEGLLILQQEVKPENAETFKEFALRFYQMEIKLMLDALSVIESENAPMTNLQSDHPVHKRMSKDLESEMLEMYRRRNS